jgi:hypothetical protein
MLPSANQCRKPARRDELLDFSASTSMSVLRHRIVKTITRNVVMYKQDLTPDVVSASRHRLRNMLNSWRERRESEHRSRGSDPLTLLPSRWGQSACSTARPDTRAVGNSHKQGRDQSFAHRSRPRRLDQLSWRKRWRRTYQTTSCSNVAVWHNN